VPGLIVSTWSFGAVTACVWACSGKPEHWVIDPEPLVGWAVGSPIPPVDPPLQHQVGCVDYNMVLLHGMFMGDRFSEAPLICF